MVSVLRWNRHRISSLLSSYSILSRQWWMRFYIHMSAQWLKDSLKLGASEWLILYRWCKKVQCQCKSHRVRKQWTVKLTCLLSHPYCREEQTWDCLSNVRLRREGKWCSWVQQIWKQVSKTERERQVSRFPNIYRSWWMLQPWIATSYCLHRSTLRT